MRSEVPILARAGFDVSVQDSLGSNSLPSETLELQLNLEFSASSPEGVPRTDDRFGPRSRISVRTSPLSPLEYEVLNSEFDAILVVDIEIAHALASRFAGVVLFRDYGRVPSQLGGMHFNEERSPTTRSTSKTLIVHVPIFGTIPPPSMLDFDDRVVLRTVAPPLPHAPSRLPSRGRVVNVFAAFACREQWFFPWLARLLESTRNATIRVFGTDQEYFAAISALGAEWLPRMRPERYGPLFASADVWVYPYSDPRHSHYVPLEAISLGMPCVLLDRTAITVEGAHLIKGRRAEFGIVDDLDAMIDMAASILDSTDHGERIVYNQQELLTPFSADAVQSQAEKLKNVVNRLAPPKASMNWRSVSASDVGPPSGSEYLDELRNGLPTSARVDASVIAFPLRMRRELAIDFVSRHGLPASSFPSIRFRFGDETALDVGALSHTAQIAGRFSIRCIASNASSAPINLIIHSAEVSAVAKYLPRAEALPRAEPDREALVTLTFDVRVEPDDAVRIEIRNALAGRQLTVHAIEVERLSDSDTRPMTPSIDAEVRSGGTVPVWPFMTLSDRSPGRKRALAQRACVMRVQGQEIAGETIDFEFVREAGSPLKSRLGIVLARGAGRVPFRILAVRIGPLAFNNKSFSGANMHLLALGGPATLKALRVRQHGDAK